MTNLAAVLAIWALVLCTIFGGIACWAAIHDRRHQPTPKRIDTHVTDEALEEFLTDLEANPPGGTH